MIQPTLPTTKAATFSVLLPSAKHQGMPMPMGTGFFVSPDGWFVTAAHVITANNKPDGPVRDDLNQAWLQKETRVAGGPPGALCQHVTTGKLLPAYDIALLKVDFKANANKAWLTGLNGFPHLKVSSRQLDEGEQVYGFGYPLSSGTTTQGPGMVVGHNELHPRVTSAIVSSTFEHSKMIVTGNDAQVYVLDKALNYGNSGGPIVAVSSGCVHAVCSRFQPVGIPQAHLANGAGQVPVVYVPSLYGIVSSLANPGVLDALKSLGVPIVGE
jgi:serine protease Do